jgi:hypothetical protein
VVVESHRVFAFVAGIDVTAVSAISTAGIAGLTCIVKILSGAAFWKTSTCTRVILSRFAHTSVELVEYAAALA